MVLVYSNVIMDKPCSLSLNISMASILPKPNATVIRLLLTSRDCSRYASVTQVLSNFNWPTLIMSRSRNEQKVTMLFKIVNLTPD